MQILDHGYVRFVESWGHGDVKISEAGIVEAARQSTQGAFRGWEEDLYLLKFLIQNKHDSPFEFAGMVIEIQAPIFVFREWHRHRTQSYNEMSARYSPVPEFWYMPTVDRCLMVNDAGKNKQAGAVKGSPKLTDENTKIGLEKINNSYAVANDAYQWCLKNGFEKGVARIPMPVGQYSRMRASANLRNWIGFLSLRQDPAAQWEIRQYANAVAELIAEQFPKTYGLFLERKEKESKLKNFLFRLKEITLSHDLLARQDLMKALEKYGI